MQIDAGAELRLYWSINNSLAVNVVGAIVNGTVTFDQALADALGSSIKSAFTNTLAAHMPASTQLLGIGIRDLRTDSQTEFREAGAPQPGTAIGDALPAGDAVCVTARTALSGKSFRGRTYISGWTEDSNSALGAVAPTSGTAAVLFMDNVDAALKGNGMAQAVLSRPSEAKVIQEITTHGDGTTTVRTLSRVSAKSGQATQVISRESRNANWESQRRRDNSRGSSPVLFQPVFRSTGVETPAPTRARR